jgi:hypothetical protein
MRQVQLAQPAPTEDMRRMQVEGARQARLRRAGGTRTEGADELSTRYGRRGGHGRCVYVGSGGEGGHEGRGAGVARRAERARRAGTGLARQARAPALPSPRRPPPHAADPTAKEQPHKKYLKCRNSPFWKNKNAFLNKIRV